MASSMDVGIDLGTATVIVYLDGEIVLKEPSVVAVSTVTGSVLTVGEEAYKMLGRTPDSIRAIRPLANGVISDYELTEEMIKYFLKKVCSNMLVKPRVAICVPSGITEVESRAVVDAAVAAGARKVYLIEEPVAAAIGAGVDLAKPNGTMILDIGGGTADIAVLSLNGIVTKTSIKVAGNKMDEAIVRAIRLNHNVLIGEKTAEQIKIQIGTVFSPDSSIEMEVKGRCLVTGLPKKIMVSQQEIYDALIENTLQIVSAMQWVLERTPPELVGDIHTNGIIMTGGGSCLGGFDRLISEKLKADARVAENPDDCVAIGTGRSFEFIESLYDGFVNMKTHQH